MSAMELRESDLELVAGLRENGRASFEALATRVGLSRKVVRAHVQRLFDEGVLRVVATVAPEYDDIHAIAHLSVTVVGDRREEVARRLAERPETVFVSIVSGHANVVAELRTTDLRRLADVVDDLSADPGIAGVQTLVYADVLKEPHLPPPTDGDWVAPQLDEHDHTLIRLLRQDGRASYSDLAGQVGLSAAATRARVRHLLTTGVIRIVALVNPTTLGRSFMTGFALDLFGPAETTFAAIGKLGTVDFLARTLGHADAIGTLVTATAEDTIAALDEIAGLPGVREVRSWTHLRLLQERYA